MRLFIALDINSKIKKNIQILQKKLATDEKTGKPIISRGIKWVDPSLAHFTLKFLGEVKDENVKEVCQIVENTAAKHTPFSLQVAIVGSFGRRAPSVIWITTKTGTENITALAKSIELNFSNAGFKPENRPYHPHLTLARIKNPHIGTKLAKKIPLFADFYAGIVDVEAVCVYQSTLTPKGPIYTKIAEYELEK